MARPSPTAGYSGRPLAAKLGIRPKTTVVALGAPSDYEGLLEPLPDGVELVDELPTEAAFIHCFTTAAAELAAALPSLERALTRDGVLWLSWPKKSSGVETDLTREVVRELGLRSGLVDVKVCAVDERWSGLKFVYRLRDR